MSDCTPVRESIDMAAHAAANVAAVPLFLFALDHRDGVDREEQASRQLHEWRRSDGRRNGKVLGEQRVQYGKSIRIRHEARDLDDASEAASAVLEHRPQIRECLTSLRLDESPATRPVAGSIPGCPAVYTTLPTRTACE